MYILKLLYQYLVSFKPKFVLAFIDHVDEGLENIVLMSFNLFLMISS